jgi:hypothetical protein
MKNKKKEKPENKKEKPENKKEKPENKPGNNTIKIKKPTLFKKNLIYSKTNNKNSSLT